MPQPMLLVIEMILLAATAYIFWLTRKLLSEARNQPSLPAASNLEVAQDVAELLAELQAAANAARTDWARQNAMMQETVQRAERVSAELRSLLAQTTRAQADPPVEPARVPEPTPVQTEMTLGQALIAFGEELRRRGQHQDTIDRWLSHLREFASWWGGRHWQSAQLGQLELNDVESYANYLKTKQYKPITLQRKQAALRSFMNWINAARQTRPEVASVPLAEGKGTAANIQSRAQTDHYAAAFVLYNQGLDLETIAARTGLERDAVRMLLSMGPPAHVSH